MLKQFLNLTLRNIKRNKSYSLISITGLALGMAIFFLILSFILFETNYESFEKNAGKTFNVYWSDADGKSTYGTSPYVLAKVFRENYSGIAECAQVSEEYDYGRLKILSNNNEFKAERVFYAEPRLFDILHFDLLTGSIDNFKNNVNSVLLSESAVQKYYGGFAKPGSIIQVKSAENIESFMISGIIKDRPQNSQLRPDFIFTMAYFKSKIPPQFVDQWGVNNPVSYFKLNAGVNPERLLSSIKDIQKRFMPDFRKSQIFNIVSLKDVHLHTSKVTGFFGSRGSLNKIYVFAFIGLLILIVSGINFINLNTARASLRVKEISVRKLLGANRNWLFMQITAESVLFALLALPVALLISDVIGKYFFDTLNREMSSSSIFNSRMILYMIAVPVLTGVLSGLYTAYYSIKHIAIEEISSGIKIISGGTTLRRLLIGFQFVVFTGLLIGSIVIYKQMKMMISDDLGYNKENLLILDKPDDKYSNSLNAFINELKNRSGIENVSLTSSLPPAVGNTIFSNISPAGSPDKRFETQLITCDENYISTMGLKLLEGNNFSDAGSADELIVNETAANKLGFGKNAAGESIVYGNKTYKICGVIKDFISQSFYNPVAPLIIKKSNEYSYKIAVKYRPELLEQSIASVTDSWKSFFNQSVLNISFSDQELQKVYDNDLRFSKMIFMLTLISIFISSIGLASLTAITSAKRKKEIGIRKVLGASIPDIIRILSKEIFYISLISTIIAWPLSFYLMKEWLSSYAYRVDLSLIYPLSAFALGFLIASAAVGYQIVKTAMTNPVESLRYE